MFVLGANIKIGKLKFTRVHDVKIIKSVDLLSDTAVIKMPASALFGNEEEGFEKKRLETEIKAGDKVEITLSYIGVYEKVEFKGFVAFVKPNTPIVEIQCEDAIYHIRKKRINKNFGKTDLSSVLNHIIKDTEVKLAGNIPEVNFDKFILKDINGAKALDKIKSEYGLSVFINDAGDLYAGLRQDKGNGETVVYDLYRNVIKHDLKFRNAEDVDLYVKVIGVKKDNTKVEVFVGEKSGEQRTIYKYNISDKKVLKNIGEAELDKLKFTGYDGKITSFLVPFADRGMSVEIRDKNFPNRSGLYFIPKVTITFGQNGARRVVELGNKS